MCLVDEITDFLKEHGLLCQTETTTDIRVLSVDICKGKVRHIIPLSLESRDIEDAAANSEKVSELISLLKEKTGAYPLVIAEDRWKSQTTTIRKRLLSHLEIFTQVYARNCEVRKIDKKTAAEFLSANHSYSDASCRYRYGLYLKRHTGHNADTVNITSGTLVAVATFSNARKWIKGNKTIRSYEWTRYASLPDVRLSGGMGKLLKIFINEVNPDDIMTYADLEWSEGKVYETLGFTLEGIKDPVMFSICKDTWKRTAITGQGQISSDIVYFQNFGSNKYRMKLTEYQ